MSKSSILAFFRRHFTLVFTIVVACVLRFSYLGSLPAGLAWDEAAIAYNGYGIVTVHRDEWLQKMPITFKSFGDYKAAAAIYLDAISTFLFGIHTFAIRFPMAFAGVVTTGLTYWMGIELFRRRSIATLAALFVAVSPWNIQFSRIAFESGIGVMFVTACVAFLLAARKKPWMYVCASLCAVLAMYAYHSTKMVLPLLFLSYAVWQKQYIKQAIKWIFLSGVIGIILLLPLMKETVYGKAGERFYMTSVIFDQKGIKPLHVWVPQVSANIAAHLSPSFLVFGQTSTLRHGTGSFGVLTYTEFVFLVIGLIFTVKTKNPNALWLLLVMGIGLFPAIVSNDAPHSNRAHGVIPFIQLFIAWGCMQAYASIQKLRYAKHIMYAFTVVFCVQTVAYVMVYIQTYRSTQAAKEFQYGYEQAVQYARQKEGEVDKVLFTSAYGQPYIYILLYKKLTPIQFHQGALANYEIRDLNWPSDKQRKNTLFVGTPKEIPADASHIVHEIFYPDGEVAFRIVQQ